MHHFLPAARGHMPVATYFFKNYLAAAPQASLQPGTLVNPCAASSSAGNTFLHDMLQSSLGRRILLKLLSQVPVKLKYAQALAHPSQLTHVVRHTLDILHETHHNCVNTASTEAVSNAVGKPRSGNYSWQNLYLGLLLEEVALCASI